MDQLEPVFTYSCSYNQWKRTAAFASCGLW